MNEAKNIDRPTKKAWSIAFVSGSCYRVVTDRFLGYEVQKKKRFLFWTWWEQVNFTNTHSTLEEAKEYIKNGCPKCERSDKQKVVCGWCGNELCDSQKFNNTCFKCGKSPYSKQTER